MGAVAFFDVRRRLAESADDAESEPVFITPDGGKTLVWMAAGKWVSNRATAQLLSTEATRAALARSLARTASGPTMPHDLDDLRCHRGGPTATGAWAATRCQQAQAHRTTADGDPRRPGRRHRKARAAAVCADRTGRPGQRVPGVGRRTQSTWRWRCRKTFKLGAGCVKCACPDLCGWGAQQWISQPRSPGPAGYCVAPRRSAACIRRSIRPCGGEPRRPSRPAQRAPARRFRVPARLRLPTRRTWRRRSWCCCH